MQAHSSSSHLVVAVVASVPWLLPVSALTQESPPVESGGGVNGFISVGPALTTEYEGASDYELVPLVIGRIEAFGVGFEIEGLDARLNVRPDSPFQFGPAVTYRPGREDVSNDVVDRLSTVDDAVEIGGFVRYQFTELFSPDDEFEFGAQVLADVAGSHEGLIIGLNGGYATFFGQRWRLGLGAEATWVSDDYMETYFAVDSADAARSGLAFYDPEGGLKDISAETTLSYNFTERWGVIGRAEYTRLIGDAADSPIVEREGTPDQFFAGVAISYRF